MRSTHFSKSRMTICAQEGTCWCTRKKLQVQLPCPIGPNPPPPPPPGLGDPYSVNNPPPLPPARWWSLFRVDPYSGMHSTMCECVRVSWKNASPWHSACNKPSPHHMDELHSILKHPNWPWLIPGEALWPWISCGFGSPTRSREAAVSNAKENAPDKPESTEKMWNRYNQVVKALSLIQVKREWDHLRAHRESAPNFRGKKAHPSHTAPPSSNH